MLASIIECSPSYYPYTIEVTYKEDASSQAIEVFQLRNMTSAWVQSIYGYGKDNLIESTNICVKEGLYQFICTSRFLFCFLSHFLDCIHRGKLVLSLKLKHSVQLR